MPCACLLPTCPLHISYIGQLTVSRSTATNRQSQSCKAACSLSYTALHGQVGGQAGRRAVHSGPRHFSRPSSLQPGAAAAAPSASGLGAHALAGGASEIETMAGRTQNRPLLHQVSGCRSCR